MPPNPNFNTQTRITRSEVDETLKSFLKTGQFILTDKVLSGAALDYMSKYLAQQPHSSTGLDYTLYLDNIIFDIKTPEIYSHNNPREFADDELLYLLQEIFRYSPKWSVIALDQVTIVQNTNHYPLSLNFLWRFGNQITRNKENPQTGKKEKELIVTKALIITNAEFHSWVWIELLTSRSKLDSLTIELLANREQEESIAHLCDVLRYSDINILNLANTEFTVNGYRTLNNFLNTKVTCYLKREQRSLSIF